MNQTSKLSSAVSGWTLWQLNFFQLASNCCASNSSNLFSKGPKVIFGKTLGTGNNHTIGQFAVAERFASPARREALKFPP